MKKRLFLALVTILSIVFLVACGSNEKPDSGSNNKPLSEISGITFTDATYTYDGTEKTLLITGTLPSGVEATYTNNKGTNPNTYNATVVLSGEGYKTLTLTAKLVIEEDQSAIAITGITFTDATYTYDGTEKTLLITGTLPSGVEATYTENKKTDAGTYNATVTLNGEGYRVLVLNANLIINKAEITGITFTDATYTYDGTEKTLLITGSLPSGVDVAYTENKGTNAKEYSSSAVLSGSNYNTLTLNAKLKIKKADILNITLDGKSVEYDTFEHSLQIVGNVPSGVTVTYTYNGVEKTSETEVGEYDVLATLSGSNYNTLVLDAVLKITSTEELLHSTVFGGNIYFQNNLDDNKLYKVNSAGTLSKVSNDIANYFAQDGSSLYFHSKGMLSSSIASLSGSSVNKLFRVNANYLTTDGTNLYYAIANLINYQNTNGIYKLDITDVENELTPIKLTNDKASHLIYNNGYIYYINSSNDDKICKIAVTANEGTSSVVVNRKTEELIVDNNILYYTAKDGSLNWKIFKYSISSNQETELSSNRGKYLTVTNNNIYYINIDLLTSSLFGKGIYRTSILGSGINEKVIETTNNGYSSLTSDGNNLYYYKLNDKHFYKYNISSETETDLMQSFVPVEDTAVSGYTQITEYKGELYYINPLDSGSVYKYNLNSGAKYKVLSENVSNIYFNDGYLYYSTYVLTNYALFRMDLSTNESVKIATHRADNLIFTDDYIYYTRVKAVGFNNSLMRMDFDGSNQTELYNDKNIYVSSLAYKDGKIYFCSNPLIGSKTLYVFDTETETATSMDVNAEICLVYMDDIYYYYNKALYRLALSGGTPTQLYIESGAEITYMYESDGIIFYSTTKNNTETLYAYMISGAMNAQLASGGASAICKSGNKIYYIKAKVTYEVDYPVISGNGHLYSINLSSRTDTKIA